MKITILTVVYNCEKYIEEAINSVLEQTYDDIEYIVVDGKSSDNTWSIIQRIKRNTDGQPHHITRAISEKDEGLYDAINKGVRMATGDYIGVVHANDRFYSADVIEHVARKLAETHCDLLYGDGMFVNADNVSQETRNWVGGKYSKRKVRYGWLPLHPTVYIKKAVYERYGLYDKSFRIAGDTDLLVRLLYSQNLHVAYLHKYIIRMRMGGMSTSRSLTTSKWAEDMRVVKRYQLPRLFLPCKVLRKIPQFLTARGGVSYVFSKLIKIMFKHK